MDLSLPLPRLWNLAILPPSLSVIGQLRLLTLLLALMPPEWGWSLVAECGKTCGAPWATNQIRERTSACEWSSDMGEFDTLTSMFGDRFDRIEDKLDAYLANQATLSKKVAVLEEKHSSLATQFRTLMGAIGAVMLACLGWFIK
jgi:hypothetical protein